ncbi:MAG: DUF445 family protein [Nitrospirae bacterium]|nr:DUF445 family protein [Nitrospirota bacterium]
MNEFMVLKMIVISALIGGLIGYFTNALAILMLFRPYCEKKIWGINIPFTPGMIPRDQPKLAKSIGEIVGKHLLSDEMINNALKDKGFESSVNDYISNKAGNYIPGEFLKKNVCLIIAPLVISSIKFIFPRVISKVDIPRIVESKIKSYEAKNLETLVYQVSKKHLRYITLLGGVIGFIIGIIQAILLLLMI